MTLRSLLDRYLPSAYRALFADEFTWSDNPILRREALRESRRRDRSLLLLIMLATMLLAFVVATWIFQYAFETRLFRHRVPPALGGSIPVACFAIFSGFHVWFVWHSAYRRSYYLLIQEYRQNSLATLLCTRIPAFQLLLMAAQHPFRQGLLAALVGLPFYAWSYSIGGASLTEILTLYAFFAMISFRPPRWSLPVFAGIPAEEILKRQRGGKPKTWGEWWLYNSFWLATISAWYLQWAFGPRWLTKLVWPLTDLLTNDISSILPGFVFTWVLAVVRFLCHPVAFFSFQIAPIFVLLPMYLFARLMSIWESSIQLRVGDTEPTTTVWDAPEYWRMRRAYGIAMAFMLLGLLWNPYVQSGLTSVLLVVQGRRGEIAVAGIFYLIATLGALVCWARAREMSAVREMFDGRLMADFKGEKIERTALWEAWYVYSPLATVYLIYAFSGLLAGTNPFPPAVLRILAPLLLLTLGGAIYVRSFPAGARNYVLSLLFPLAAWFIPFEEWGGLAASISPLAGILSLSEHTSRILGEIPTGHSIVAPWYVSALLAPLTGLLLHQISHRRRAIGQADLEAPIAPSQPSKQSPPIQTVLAAVSAELKSLPPVIAQPLPENASPEPPPPKVKAPRFLQKRDTPAALALIRMLQSKWDNAVAAKELRVLFRGHLGRDEQIIFPLMMVALLLAALYRADIARTFLEGPARLVFSSGSQYILGGSGMGSDFEVILGGLAAVQMLIMSFAGAVAATSVCGTAFARERDKSTLGFVLVTPMPTLSIVAGKFIGMLAPTLLVVSLLSVWCAILCVPVAMEIGPKMTYSGLAIAVAICFLLCTLAGALGLCFSTLFRRESDSTAISMLLLFATIFWVSYMTVVWPMVFPYFAAGGSYRWIWLSYLAVADLVLIPSALLFTYWRLNRARRGDVAFESAKK